PAARYASAAELAEDLDRYLTGEPVIARPVNWWHRRWRWLRKHFVGPTLAVTAAVAFLVLLAVIVVQSISFHKQVKQTNAARQEAESYRQALEIAEEKAARLQSDAAADQRDSGKLP
ncbi:MAG: hypothetical protein WD049_01950, partial [Candidatus Paceibacterota bacterium]